MQLSNEAMLIFNSKPGQQCIRSLETVYHIAISLKNNQTMTILAPSQSLEEVVEAAILNYEKSVLTFSV